MDLRLSAHVKYFTSLSVFHLVMQASSHVQLLQSSYELQDRGSSSFPCVECLFQYFIEVHMKFF